MASFNKQQPIDKKVRLRQQIYHSETIKTAMATTIASMRVLASFAASPSPEPEPQPLDPGETLPIAMKDHLFPVRSTDADQARQEWENELLGEQQKRCPEREL
jgi:hypothetical protein